MSVKIFIHLLQCAVNDLSADHSLFAEMTEKQWVEVYQIAHRQALLGVIYDEVLSLPLFLQPSRNLRLKWFMIVQRIENDNLRLNHVLGEFDAQMQANRIDYILLKGQGQASFYQNPLRRQSGDIDLYFPSPKQYEDAISWAQKQQHELKTAVKHVSFDWKGAYLEFHEDLGGMHYPVANRHWNRFLSTHMAHGCQHLSVSGLDIKGLPPEVNLMYLLLHVLGHFIAGGIGLRQFMDWARYARAHDASVNKESMTRLLRQTGIYRFACAFASVQVEILGLPLDKLPFFFDPDSVPAGLVQDIMEGGNFGFHRDEERSFSNKWVCKCHTASRIFRRVARFYRFTPTEMLWLPIHYGMSNLNLLVRGKL